MPIQTAGLNKPGTIPGATTTQKSVWVRREKNPGPTNKQRNKIKKTPIFIPFQWLKFWENHIKTIEKFKLLLIFKSHISSRKSPIRNLRGNTSHFLGICWFPPSLDSSATLAVSSSSSLPAGHNEVVGKKEIFSLSTNLIWILQNSFLHLQKSYLLKWEIYKMSELLTKRQKKKQPKKFYAKENFKQKYYTSSNLVFSCSFKPLFTRMFCALWIHPAFSVGCKEFIKYRSLVRQHPQKLHFAHVN